MAFGRSEIKRIKNAVLEDQLVRSNIATTERTNKLWKKKWGWVLDEHEDLHKKLKEISKDSQFLSDVNKGLTREDDRDINPVPATTNHQYGWIANKPEFWLEKYGPDYENPPPLPPHYGITKNM